MKYKTAFLVMLICIFVSCSKDITGVYTFNNNPNEIIKIYQNNFYTIVTKHLDENGNGLALLTEGNYEVKNNLLFLHNSCWYKKYDGEDDKYDVQEIDLTIVYKIINVDPDYIYASIEKIYKRESAFVQQEKQEVTSMIGNKVLFCKID